MVDRWLFSDWVLKEIEQVAEISGKTGWAPVPLGFLDILLAFQGNTIATDCSAFDWTFPSWLIANLVRAHLEQCKDQDVVYQQMVLRRYSQVLGPDCIVRLPDGTRLQQQFWGLMKSGWLRTISENSCAQVMINCVAWLRAFPDIQFPHPIWTMGDDVIMAWPLDYTDETIQRFLKALSSVGVIIKQWTDELEFAGFSYARESGRYKVRPLYPSKHMYSIGYTKEPIVKDVALAFNLLYSMSELSPGMEQFILDNSPVSRSFAYAWAVGLISGSGIVNSVDWSLF